MVKKIFETYLHFGSGKETAKFLDLCGLKTPVKVSRKGIPHGGDEFTGMYIYRVLQNPLYLGLTKHYDKTYPGEHEAIIDKKTWDKAQELLAFNLTHSGKKDIRFSPLRGLIRCGCYGGTRRTRNTHFIQTPQRLPRRLGRTAEDV